MSAREEKYRTWANVSKSFNNLVLKSILHSPRNQLKLGSSTFQQSVLKLMGVSSVKLKYLSLQRKSTRLLHTLEICYYAGMVLMPRHQSLPCLNSSIKLLGEILLQVLKQI